MWCCDDEGEQYRSLHLLRALCGDDYVNSLKYTIDEIRQMTDYGARDKAIGANIVAVCHKAAAEIKSALARLDERLDAFGQDPASNNKTVMQGVVVYAPDELDNAEAESDGRLRSWFERVVDVAASQWGEDNIMGAYVDLDEVHNYTAARDGTIKQSKRRMHLYAAPVCGARPRALARVPQARRHRNARPR